VPSGTHWRFVTCPPAAQNSRTSRRPVIDEGIVFADGCDLLIALGLIGIVAEAGGPLRAVHVPAEEIWRRVREGCFLRAEAALMNVSSG